MELWLPWLKIAFIALGGLSLFLVSRRSKLDSEKTRPVFRALFRLFSITIFVFVVYLAFMQGGNRNSKLAGSPDGRFVARVIITSGTLADSNTSAVIVRRAWSPTWHRAYSGYGYFQERGPVEPYLYWKDESHLVIKYQKSEVEPSSCLSQVEGILIECKAENW